MSKARHLGNLLDTDGDVVGDSLDNVPTPSKTSIEALGIALPAANLTGTINIARMPAALGIPTVTSISDTLPTQTEIEANFNLTITGTFFVSGCAVQFIGNDGTSYTSPVVTFTDATTIVARINTNIDATKEPYKVTVTNPSGHSGSLVSAFNINANPAFSVASGTLGTLEDSDRVGSNLTTLATSDPESGTVTVTATGYPAGLTLSTAGVWGGTANAVSSDTTTTFTATATDDATPANVVTRSYSITVNCPKTMLNILGGITNAQGHVLSSGTDQAGCRIILDPSDPNCYSGSGTTLTNVSPNETQAGTAVNMTIGGSGSGKYFEMDINNGAYIHYGSANASNSPMSGGSNDSYDIMAYCGWWYPTSEFKGTGGDVLWCFSDGDWGPNGQFGVVLGRHASTDRGVAIHAGSTHRHAWGPHLRNVSHANKWLFIFAWHKMSGGLLFSEGWATDTNLTWGIEDSNESSGLYGATSHPLKFGGRADTANEGTPAGYRMGQQALWGQGGQCFANTLSDAKIQAEAIFDASKSNYL